MILIKQISILILLAFMNIEPQEKIIIDSNLTFEEAVKGTKAPEEILKNLKLIDVEYFSFDGKLHKGQIIVNKDREKEVKEIFEKIKKIKFPVEKVIPIVKYNWDDETSMRDNNSSGFNYRVIAGTKKLSLHATGNAIDINPFQNPYIKGKLIAPKGSKYDKKAKGTILEDSEIVKLFKSKGWEWGGDWKNYKDYQHFDFRKD